MCIYSSFAQLDLKYWDWVAYFHFGGGMVYPGSDLKNASSIGLFAKNGYQVYGDFNFMIINGLGLGLNIEYDQFFFNKTAFKTSAKPEFMDVYGNYTSTKFGLNILMNIPIVVNEDKFIVNLYGELNPGLRGFNIPNIDLYYDENVNKYVEVHYHTRKNTMGYIGYSGGLQMLFSNKWGINLSYNTLFKTRHSIKYSVRMFDAFGNLTESENYLNNYLNHSGWQVGVVLLLGKK